MTPLASKGNKQLVSLDIGQHNAMEIFSVKWNVVSATSKVILNDIFAELDGSSGIKNIITDKLNLGELYKEIYTNQVNQALRRCFFSIFSENCERGISTVFRLSIMRVW